MDVRQAVAPLAFSVLFAGSAALVVHLTQGNTRSTLWAPSWVWVFLLGLFVLADSAPLRHDFDRRPVGYGTAAVPLIIALVYLAPIQAVVIRSIGGCAGMVISRRVPFVERISWQFIVAKTGFLAFQLAAMMLIFRAIPNGSGSDPRLVVNALVTTTVAIVAAMALDSALRKLFDRSHPMWPAGSGRWICGALVIGVFASGLMLSMALVDSWLLPAIAAGMFVAVWCHRAVESNASDLARSQADQRLVTHVTDSLDLNTMVSNINREVGAMIDAASVAIVLYLPNGSQNARSVIGEFPIIIPERADLLRWHEALASGITHILEFDPNTGERLPAQTQTLCVPLTDESEVVGVLMAANSLRSSARFERNQVRRAEGLSRLLTPGLRKRELFDRLRYTAHHDALTGLPTRSIFEKQIDAVLNDQSTPGAWFLIACDIDRFKDVNDALGHDVGDAALAQFAVRVGALLEQGDAMCRLGGDEFALLCRRSSHDEVAAFAHRFGKEVGKPARLVGVDVVISTSIGITEITRADIDVAQPMRRADLAMYSAKRHRTGVEFYDASLDRRGVDRMALVNDLRIAVAEGELGVLFQPKVDLVTGLPVAVEAFVRWQHPTRGTISPSDFIPMSENIGLVPEITRYVLIQSLAVLKSAVAADLGLGVSMHLSANDLFDTDLPDRVRSYLDRDGLDPSLLTLEITEAAMLVEDPRSRTIIDHLSTIGVRISIDDFGVGHSSLVSMRTMSVHELKIDGASIGHLANPTFDELTVNAAICLGHNLGLKVVGKMVDSEQQLEILKRLGCDYAQGYFLARPLAATDLIGWVGRVRAARQPDDPTGWFGSIQ